MHKAALIALGIDPKQVPAGAGFTITPFGAPGHVRIEWTGSITVSTADLVAALAEQ